jgi:hypothetical protein
MHFPQPHSIPSIDDNIVFIKNEICTLTNIIIVDPMCVDLLP